MREATAAPHAVCIEDIQVTGWQSRESFFFRLLETVRYPGQSLVFYLNVHVANTAFWNKPLKQVLQKGDLVYCDGAGIVWASKMLGQPLPKRLTSADWFLDLLAYLARQEVRVFLLGADPDTAQKAMARINEAVPQHSVVGIHHGYIHHDSAVEAQVIEAINASNADLLIVGFGTPLQEMWIDRNRSRLDVSTIYAIGAVLDFVSGTVSRCPGWMGEYGLEWLYRFCMEPSRMFMRYVVGNPWFMARILATSSYQALAEWLAKPVTLFPAKA